MTVCISTCASICDFPDYCEIDPSRANFAINTGVPNEPLHKKKPLFTLLFPGWLCLFLSFFLAGRLILTRICWDFVSTKSIMSAAGWLKRNNSFLARASVTLVSCSIIYAFSSTLGFNKVKQKHTL